MGIIGNGKLISHGSHAPFEKIADPSGVSEYRLKFTQNITDGNVVSITLDDSLIYATQAWTDENYVPRDEIVDDLTTDDAKKPVSAKQAKLLQDNKLDANKRGAISGVASLDENKKVPVTELPSATPSAAGVMKLINDLKTGGTDAALTAEQAKQFFEMFSGGVGHFRIPNPLEITKPWIIQFGSLYVNGGTTGTTINLPIAFPNEAISFSAFWIQTSQVTTNVPTYMGNFTPNRAQFKIFTDQAAGNNGTYWLAIGY